jgi:polyribonucleotide nucleotidyltransferase
MIGHGALAEKALVPIIPPQAEFPYTIRLVSETLASNGSSSMGSVCAATLALMDGGVPIKRPVAGIASGVMMNKDKYVLLTDIQGPEDEFGDMDFKVAGTTKGVTAIQMDVKVDGVILPILVEALEKARLARLHILNTMTQTIATPRATVSARTPQILILQILPEQIGLVIGGGGKPLLRLKTKLGSKKSPLETMERSLSMAAMAQPKWLPHAYNNSQKYTKWGTNSL